MSYLYPFDELNKVWAREKINELMDQINEKAPDQPQGLDESERVVIVVTES